MTRDELQKVAQARLYPSLTNPNYLVLRSRRLIFASCFKTLPDNLTVLDVGGRYQPYRPLLNGKIRRYVALDMDKTELLSVVGNGEELPFRDETFDLAIATVVFEYFKRPQQAALEIHRVLRPGGTLMASLGAVVPRFGEEEYWRYLPRSLQHIFSAFSQIKIVPEVSSLGGFCRLINLGFHDFLKLQFLKSAYEFTFCPLLNLVGLSLEKSRMTSNDKWTGNYTVLAVK